MKEAGPKNACWIIAIIGSATTSVKQVWMRVTLFYRDGKICASEVHVQKLWQQSEKVIADKSPLCSEMILLVSEVNENLVDELLWIRRTTPPEYSNLKTETEG